MAVSHVSPPIVSDMQRQSPSDAQAQDPHVRGAEFVFVAERSHRALGIRQGDRIVMRPGHVQPVTIIHTAPPNYGRLLQLLEDGVITPLHGDEHEAAVLCLRQQHALAHPPLRVMR